MNTCERFSELFSDYVENFLPASSKQQLETHLSACADCHDTVARLDDLRGHLKSLKPIEASDDFEAVLRARIKLDQRTRRSSVAARQRTRPVRMASYTVIAVIIMTSFGYLLWRNQTDIQAATPASTFQIQTPVTVTASLAPNPASFSAKVLYPLDRITPAQLSTRSHMSSLAPQTGAKPDTSQPALVKDAVRQEQLTTVSSF